MTIYADDAVSAFNDIVEAVGGQPNIIFTREGEPLYDEATDTNLPGAPEAYPHYAVIERASAGPGDTFDTVRRIRTNSRKLTVPAYKLAIIPIPGDSVVFSGDTWSLVSVDPLSPDGAVPPILYEITVSR